MMVGVHTLDATIQSFGRGLLDVEKNSCTHMGVCQSKQGPPIRMWPKVGVCTFENALKSGIQHFFLILLISSCYLFFHLQAADLKPLQFTNRQASRFA